MKSRSPRDVWLTDDARKHLLEAERLTRPKAERSAIVEQALAEYVESRKRP